MSSGIVTQPLTKAILRWLLGRREATAHSDPATGRSVLSYGKPYRIVVSIMLALSTALVALGIVASEGDLSTLAICTLVFGTMWAGSAWALYEALLVRIEISRDGLFRRVRDGRELHLPWTAITSVTYSESMNWLVYRAEGLDAIRVSIFRDGLSTLAGMSTQHLSGDAARVAAALLEESVPVPGLGGQR